MRIKSQKDFWAGLMFLAFGIVFAVGAYNYPMGSSARPGPGYFPLGLGVLLAILGAIEVFKALTIESEGGDPVGRIAWRPLIIILLAVGLFGVLLPRLGMAISLPVLVILSSFASDEFTWKSAIINSVVLTVFSYLVFIKGLGLTIPLWPVFAAAA